MIFVPYEKFNDIELIGEGGFSKIYKATWVDCKIDSNLCTLDFSLLNESKIVALKKLNNSKNVTSKELNELRMFYHYCLSGKKLSNIYYDDDRLVNIYYGITRDPITQDIIFIMPYYNSDLVHDIYENFYDTSWYKKISSLRNIISGLKEIHGVNIIHRDLHSGNILLGDYYSFFHDVLKICDLGTSKSATESTSDEEEEEEIYGVIPYVAPEVLRELIIEICDGLRPPIITNAPDGYTDLMKECWHSDPEKRPTTVEVLKRVGEIKEIEGRKSNKSNETKIIKSSDIGPVTTNNPDATYKSRYLSGMIKSAASTRSQSISTSELDQLDFYQRNSNDKRKFEDGDSFDNGISNKKIKLFVDENNGYITKELKFDIDKNSGQSKNSGYITREIGFDI
ncbi:kinase-like domain-containing protein [Rhizophagus irregularis DAOM 181602=DAOM 197198]|nr:kinase-like domain-containing protein [Rhizophagus irregularis DAOM 181602=DAOM 197198]